MDNAFDAARDRAIRTWSLYGETSDSMLVDWVHAEPIQERSRLHNYSIEPHRHALLFQILYLSDGHAVLHLDGEHVRLDPPAAVTMPPLAAHGFDFSPDVAGTVVTLFHRDLAAIVRTAPDYLVHFERPRVVPLARYPGEAATLQDGTQAIVAELGRRDVGRDQVLSATLSLMLTALRRVDASEQRNRDDRLEPGGERAVSLVQAFQHLVDQNFATHRPVAHYAGLLGITAGHLNRVCRAVAGASALELINRRLVLEAKRHLAFTSLGIKQVSAYLGFEDPAYFTRFFGREAGLSPSAFRAALLVEGRRQRAVGTGSGLGYFSDTA
jgi:AraC family transcriptional activator of pobA